MFEFCPVFDKKFALDESQSSGIKCVLGIRLAISFVSTTRLYQKNINYVGGLWLTYIYEIPLISGAELVEFIHIRKILLKFDFMPYISM